MNFFLKKLLIIFKPSDLQIYTDGSHKNNRGSWAFVLVKKGKIVKEASGLVKRTNSLRMEISAAIEALKVLPPVSKATVFTDSRILIDAAQQDTKSCVGRPNADLIFILKDVARTHRISWEWVRAHSGIKYNEKCDELCRLARTRK